MDILISFSTSVGVVEALRVVKDVAIDVVNHCIVMSLKNKKTPSDGGAINSRDGNKKAPPGFVGVTGMFAYITRVSTMRALSLDVFGENHTYYQEAILVNSQHTYVKQEWVYPPGTDMSAFPSPPYAVSESTATVEENREPGIPSVAKLALSLYTFIVENSSSYDNYLIISSSTSPGGSYSFSSNENSYSVMFY